MCLWVPAMHEVSVADDTATLYGRNGKQEKGSLIHPRGVLCLVFGHQLSMGDDGVDRLGFVRGSTGITIGRCSRATSRVRVGAAPLLPAVDENCRLSELHGGEEPGDVVIIWDSIFVVA